MPVLYCIKCEMEDVVFGNDGNGHHFLEPFTDGLPTMTDWNVCSGPFATCPPPVHPDVEPVFDLSEEEMAISDNSAEMLLEQFVELQ